MSEATKSSEWKGGLGRTELVARLEKMKTDAEEALVEYSAVAKTQASALKNITENLPDAVEKQRDIHAAFRRKYYNA